VSRDCGLGCFSKLLLVDKLRRLSVVARGGGVLVSNNCFLQQNTTASLLELYFNDSMQTTYAPAAAVAVNKERSPMGPMHLPTQGRRSI